MRRPDTGEDGTCFSTCPDGLSYRHVRFLYTNGPVNLLFFLVYQGFAPWHGRCLRIPAALDGYPVVIDEMGR